MRVFTKGVSKRMLRKMVAFAIMVSLMVLSNATNALASYQEGYHNGDFYFYWTNDKGTVNYQNTGYGEYSVSWNSQGQSGFNFTCGKGWKYGNEYHKIHYEGKFNPGNNGYLALYGWTELPQGSQYQVAEYYVVESYGNWMPPGSGQGVESFGSFQSDGATYNIYRTTRINQPWVVNNGTGSFYQYWSVRTPKVQPGNNISGIITFKNHVEAWKSKGLAVGDFSKYYQVMETEGYESTGNSAIKFSGIEERFPVGQTINIYTDYTSGDKIMYINSNGELAPSSTVSPTQNSAIFEVVYLYQDYITWSGWRNWIPVVALKSKSTGKYVTVVNSTSRVKANASSIGNAQKFWYQDNRGDIDFRSLYNQMSLDHNGVACSSYSSYRDTIVDWGTYQ